MMKTLAFILSASLAAACAGQAEVRYSGSANAPELIAMDGDASVMVVANADEPLFYFDNVYWLYRDDAWFRSNSHRKGWVKVDTAPDRIRRIDRPHAYVHFRAGSEAQRTTLNQREQPLPGPARGEDPQRLEPGQPAQPNSQPGLQPDQPRPMTEPHANPPPPNQLPPTPDREPTLRGPQPPRDQVPPATPDAARPDSALTPDPARPPATPGMQNRSPDQRPATDPRRPNEPPRPPTPSTTP